MVLFAAASTLSIVPPLVLALVFQRFITRLNIVDPHHHAGRLNRFDWPVPPVQCFTPPGRGERAMAITINCDIGEGYGLYTFGNDERIMPFISIANVACGFHASDPSVMHATVRLALAHGVKSARTRRSPTARVLGAARCRWSARSCAIS